MCFRGSSRIDFHNGDVTRSDFGMYVCSKKKIFFSHWSEKALSQESETGSVVNEILTGLCVFCWIVEW